MTKISSIDECQASLSDWKVPTPPSFVHEPNPDKIYFVVEQSGPAHNTSESSKVNLKERRFICRATGYPNVNYRWLKNKRDFNLDNPLLSGRVTRIPGEGSFILSRLSIDDEGVYRCIAENGNGTAVDKEIHFIRTYMNLLRITQETLPVDFGEPFSRECEPATSVPKARAYWILMSGQNAERRNFQTINSTNVAINDQGTIFFQYVREEDNIPGFYYTCTSENVELKDYKFGYQFNFNVIRNPALRDSLKPYILPGSQYYSPKEMTVLKGESLELFCIVSGYPDYIPYWSKKDGQLDYSRISWNTNFNKSMKIDNVSFSDAGVYSCKFPNNDRMDKDFTVTVKAAPYWVSLPQNVNVSEHSNVDFNCNAAGDPDLTYEFYKNGQRIYNDDVKYIFVSRRLLIHDVVKGERGEGDNAVYQCRAYNEYGSLWANFYLNIQSFAPVILKGPGVVEAVEGQDAVFSCKAFGSPKPGIMWSSSIYLGEGSDRLHMQDQLDDDYIGRLTFVNVTKKMQGIFSCELENIYNRTKSDGELIVR
uniref:Ig-like domain-containing protein n=1 Tax=Romanomermis culicivorax TaxID=13658 RepID=A0A915JES0_ROMCU